MHIRLTVSLISVNSYVHFRQFINGAMMSDNSCLRLEEFKSWDLKMQSAFPNNYVLENTYLLAGAVSA